MLRAALFGLAAASLSLTAFAQSAVTKDVYACRDISDEKARLACYDTAVGRLRAAEESGDVTTISRADVEQVQRESFGFKIPSLPKFASRKGDAAENEVTSITSAVRSVSAGPGKLRVTLENGQVWTQIDDKTVRAKKPKSAEISQAALGSFKMKLDDGLAFRVRREQ